MNINYDLVWGLITLSIYFWMFYEMAALAVIYFNVYKAEKKNGVLGMFLITFVIAVLISMSLLFGVLRIFEVAMDGFIMKSVVRVLILLMAALPASARYLRKVITKHEV